MKTAVTKDKLKKSPPKDCKKANETGREENTRW